MASFVKSSHNKKVGSIGEDFAANYIAHLDYDIIERNYTSYWGEIDIIAVKDTTLVFVEVKTKIGNRYGAPWEAMTYFKNKKLARTIQYYITSKKLHHSKFRIDVCAVVLNEDLSLNKIKIYEGHF